MDLRERLNNLTQNNDIVIIDNFLREPQKILKEMTRDPGRSMEAHYPGHVYALNSDSLEQVHESLHYHNIDLGARLSQARLRTTQEQDGTVAKTNVHFDYNSLILVCYLEIPPTEKQGTYFYLSPVTGLKKFDASLSKAIHLKETFAMSEYFESWKIWHLVDPCFNRAILFDGHLFHSGPSQVSNRRTNLELRFSRK